MLDSANMESFLLQIPEDSGRRYKKKWCRYLADVARERGKKKWEGKFLWYQKEKKSPLRPRTVEVETNMLWSAGGILSHN